MDVHLRPVLGVVRAVKEKEGYGFIKVEGASSTMNDGVFDVKLRMNVKRDRGEVPPPSTISDLLGKYPLKMVFHNYISYPKIIVSNLDE